MGRGARPRGPPPPTPLGPWRAPHRPPSARRLVPRRDGEVVQDGSTADLVHDVPRLVSFASTYFTLLPGDVILTGTPAGVGPVQPGQRVSVEIEGIGTLANQFVRR